jgi:hypothetical protein
MSTSVSMEQGIKLLKQFEDSINQMSSKISLSVTQYDEYGLFVSIVFLWLVRLLVRGSMVFNITFNNISVIMAFYWIPLTRFHYNC